MFWSILQRAILIELARIFALSLLGITGILVMAGIVAEASQQGLNPAQIVAVIPLLIPSTLPYTIPATTLFACCLVYGRLAHDNEVLAIKSAGINILLIVWPGVILGLVMSSVTMGLYYHLIPYTHHLLRSRVIQDLEEYMYALLRKDHYIKQPGLNYVMFVKQVQGRRLIDVLFKRLDDKGRYDIIARAHEADLHVDIEKNELIVHMHNGEVYGGDDGQGRQRGDRTWRVPLPKDVWTTLKPRPRAMSWSELIDYRAELLTKQRADR